MNNKQRKNAQHKGKVYDPTEDMDDLINDTSGLSGITSKSDTVDESNLENTAPGGNVFKEGIDTADSQKPKSGNLQSTVGDSIRGGMSDAAYQAAKALGDDPTDSADDSQTQSDTTSTATATPGSGNSGNDTLDPAASPDEVGEQSVSGDMPDPESDDDTLLNAQNVGLRLDEDEEHPQELDIASDIDKAEEWHRTH